MFPAAHRRKTLPLKGPADPDTHPDPILLLKHTAFLQVQPHPFSPQELLMKEHLIPERRPAHCLIKSHTFFQAPLPSRTFTAMRSLHVLTQAGWRKGGWWRSPFRGVTLPSREMWQVNEASHHLREGAGEGGGERNVHPLQISLFLEKEGWKSPTVVRGPRRGVLTCFFFPSLPTSNPCLIGRLAGGG